MPRTILIAAAATVTVLATQVGAVEPAHTTVPPAVPYAAVPIPLDAVRLTGGPLEHAQELDREYLLQLNPDRMLAYLRERAGLPRKAEPYGGWDGEGRQLTGHIAGHYLSAVSYMYAATGDKRFKQRADYIVSELKEIQDKHGNGYIGALLGDADRHATTAPTGAGTTGLVNGELLFDQLRQGKIRSGGFDLNGMWSPWYVQHKIFAGLRDAYRMTGNRTALEIETRFAGWVDNAVGGLSEKQDQKMLDTEFGGMNEVLVDLYADTGEKRWLTLADRFHHKAVVDPLAAGKDNLGGKHGNTQIPKLLGELARYLYTGDSSSGAAANTFWNAVVDHHSFATGGHGYDEYFGQPDHLAGQVDGTGQRSADLRTAESCNVYNMLKMTRRLFAIHPDVRYADFQERAYYNHVLASINPNNGRTCYMVPVGPGVVHEYQGMFDDFTCCVGTGMENHALYGDGLYDVAPSGDKLWVNVYAPSTAVWAEASATLTMDTAFPTRDVATLKLGMKSPKEFTIEFRRPGWAGDGFKLAVNGQSVAELGSPDSYVGVKRTWTDGDTVSIVMPMSLHTEPLPGSPTRVALMYGPMVLAGDFGSQPSDDEAVAAADKHVDFPVFANADRPMTDWLKPVADQFATFTANTADGREITLAPFYQSHDRRYGLYWDLLTPQQWTDHRNAYAAEQARQKALAAATVAFVQIGQMQPERDFNFQGDTSSAVVRADGQPGRAGGKWISFDVKVDPIVPMSVAVTTLVPADGNTRGPGFDVAVNGMKVGTPTVRPEGTSRFAQVTFQVPPAAVAGKRSITVRLSSPVGSELPPVYGLRVLRSDAPATR